MEAQAYADLKETRDAARTQYRSFSNAERSLKTAITSLAEVGIDTSSLVSIRGAVKVNRENAQAIKEDLEAKVSAARAEYRQEKISAYIADSISDYPLIP